MRWETFGERKPWKGVVVVLGAIALACGNGADDPAAPRALDCPSADAGPAEAGAEAAADAGAEAGADADAPPPTEAGACAAMIFREDFENYAAGAELDQAWQLGVEGPNSSARVNLDAEGHGSGGSNRYVLFTNNGSDPDLVRISTATPAFDVRSCSAVSLSASVIVFSLEQTENDHAVVEARGNGLDWVPLYMPFPSPDFPPLISCRAGGQETGCVAWKTIQVEIPRVLLAPDLEVRFRLDALTSVSDFFGFDDVTLAGVP